MPPEKPVPNDGKRAPPSPIKNAYLIVYNALSAALWLGVLSKTATVGLNEIQTGGTKGFFQFGAKNKYGGLEALGSGKVYDELEQYTRLTQTLAGLEVMHSLLGIVRSPLTTTLMQVSSRFLLVWLIALPFPQTTRTSPAYTSMLLAWSVTEVIRYTYFALNLSGVGVPSWLTWLRYNTFVVLYPMGISSECWLVYKAIPEARKLNEGYAYALWAILAIYVPGAYVLITYMWKQSTKIARERRRNV